jgi:hypothetical protein
MMAKGLMARRDNNAGTKKSPLQIQMLERFYSGECTYAAAASGSVHADYVI